MRVVLRRQWISAAAFVVVLAAIFSAGTPYPWTDVPINALFALLYTVVLLRFGLLALVATDLASEFLLGVPRTLDFSAWYAGLGMAPLVALALIAWYGFHTSRGGRRLLKEDAL